MAEITEGEIQSQLERELPGIRFRAYIEGKAPKAVDIISRIPEDSPLELKAGKTRPSATGTLDEIEELKESIKEQYFDAFTEESLREAGAEVPARYRPVELPYSDTSRVLSDILDVELPETWDEIGDIIGRSAEYARENQGEYGGPDGAFAMKVREELPSDVILMRFEENICKVDKATFAAALEFFTPVQKLRAMKSRADRCGDRTAREQLRVTLRGSPTAEEEVRRKGLIRWWKEELGTEGAVDKLTRIGYSEKEAREMVGASPKAEGKSKESGKKLEESLREKIKERM